MQQFLKSIAILLLILNGTGAIYGGISLILYPDGSSLQMPISLLEHSPFSSYLIPGVILLVVNGFLSFTTLYFLWAHYKYSGYMVCLQGVLLTGWILIQIIMIQTLATLQVVFGIIGLVFILIGVLLQRAKVLF